MARRERSPDDWGAYEDLPPRVEIACRAYCRSLGIDPERDALVMLERSHEWMQQWRTFAPFMREVVEALDGPAEAGGVVRAAGAYPGATEAEETDDA